MNLPGEKQAFYEGLFDLTDHVVGEIIAGNLVTSPRPSPKQAMAALALGSLYVCSRENQPILLVDPIAKLIEVFALVDDR